MLNKIDLTKNRVLRIMRKTKIHIIKYINHNFKFYFISVCRMSLFRSLDILATKIIVLFSAIAPNTSTYWICLVFWGISNIHTIINNWWIQWTKRSNVKYFIVTFHDTLICVALFSSKHMLSLVFIINKVFLQNLISKLYESADN